MTRARNSANLASHGNLFVDIANDRTGIGSVVPAQNLHVAGTAGFHADTTFTGDLYNATWDRSDNCLKFVDNAKAKFGTGGDLEIFHNGTNSYIDNNQGDLVIGSSGTLRLVNVNNTESFIKCITNSAVEIYHDNSKKFETTAYGTNTTGTTVNDGLVVAGVATVTTMNVTGVLTYDDVTSVDSVGVVTAREGVIIPDNKALSLGNRVVGSTAGDLRLYHDGSNSYIDEIGSGNLFIRNGSDTSIFCQTDGVVKLYHDGSEKLSTTAYGIDVTGTTSTDGLAVSGVTTTGNLYADNLYANSALTLNNNASVSVNLTSTSTTGSSRIFFGDPDSALVGRINYAHNGDFMQFYTAYGERLRIANNGSVTIGKTSNAGKGLEIYSSADAALRIQNSTTGTGTNDGVLIEAGASQALVWNYESTPLKFGTAGTERFQINSSGHVVPGADSSYDLGLTGTRWRNVYADAVDVTGTSVVATLKSTNNNYVVQMQGNNASDKVYFGTTSGNDFILANTSSVTERLRITSAGKIGINQTSPYSDVDITSSVEGGSDTLAAHGIRLSAIGATDEQVIPITAGFRTQQDRVRAGIGFISKQASGTDGLAGAIGFYTRSSADGNVLSRSDERLRIDSSGRVLIGSTAKAGDSALQVYTSDQLHPAIRTNAGNANGYTMFGDAYKADESQVNIGISYSSASLVISQGCKVNTSSDDAYVSSQDTYSTRPNAIRLDTDGSFSFHSRESSATTATDNAVTLTEVFKVDRVGNIYQRISARNMYFGANNELRIGVQSNGDSNIEAVSGDLKIMDGGSVITQVRSDGLENFQHVYPSADSSKDLGKSSYRWRNIYGQTLSLSSYATIGSIVAADPGSHYYSFNNRIGGNFIVKGTTVLTNDVSSGTKPSTFPAPNVQLMVYQSTNGQPISNEACARLLIATDAKQTGAQGYHGTIDFGSSDCTAAGNSSEFNYRVASIMCRGDGDTSSSNADGDLQFFTKQASVGLMHRFDIAPNGTLTGTDTNGIGSLSDQRLKTNIQDYTYDLNKFKQLKTRTFDWINPKFHEEGNIRGFIAQEIETVDSYWNYQFEVSKENAEEDYDLLSDGDENYTIRDHRPAKASKLNGKDAMYVSVIQQLMSKIETLEAKVVALEGS